MEMQAFLERVYYWTETRNALFRARSTKKWSVDVIKPARIFQIWDKLVFQVLLNSLLLKWPRDMSQQGQVGTTIIQSANSHWRSNRIKLGFASSVFPLRKRQAVRAEQTSKDLTLRHSVIGGSRENWNEASKAAELAPSYFKH